MAEKLLKKAATAEMLGISPATLDRIAARGELPMYRIGGQCMFMESEIVNYIRGQRVAPVTCVAAAAPQRKPRGAAKTQQTRRAYIPGMKVV